MIIGTFNKQGKDGREYTVYFHDDNAGTKFCMITNYVGENKQLPTLDNMQSVVSEILGYDTVIKDIGYGRYSYRQK